MVETDIEKALTTLVDEDSKGSVGNTAEEILTDKADIVRGRYANFAEQDAAVGKMKNNDGSPLKIGINYDRASEMLRDSGGPHEGTGASPPNDVDSATHDFEKQFQELEQLSYLDDVLGFGDQTTVVGVLHGDTVDRHEIKLPEMVIGRMHLNNVIYLRSKVLKHRVILRIGRNDGRCCPTFSEHYPLARDPSRLDQIRPNQFTERFAPLCDASRLEQIRIDLEHYSTAVRNYQGWMEACGDPFLSTLSNYSGLGEDLAIQESAEYFGDVNEAVMLARRRILLKKYHPLIPKTSEDSSTIERSIREKWGSRFLRRLGVALFGGFILVVPMLIMTLHRSFLTTLLTTSLFVFAVAVALAIVKDGGYKDIIGATAAYAAVLVVFVGVSVTNLS